MQNPAPWFLEPPWVFVVFAFFWLLVTGLLARLGGWAELATRYTTTKTPISGERFWFVSGSMGTRVFPVSYSNCLFVTVTDDGAYLSILFPFRLMSPPLYLPWASVEGMEERGVLFFRSIRMRMKGQWPHVSLKGSAGRAVLRAYRLSKNQHDRQIESSAG